MTEFSCLDILLFLKAEFRPRRHSPIGKYCYQVLSKMLGPCKTKIKWCLRLNDYPLCSIDISIGYDFKET